MEFGWVFCFKRGYLFVAESSCISETIYNAMDSKCYYAIALITEMAGSAIA